VLGLHSLHVWHARAPRRTARGIRFAAYSDVHLYRIFIVIDEKIACET
jgi:hypothetical protein